MAQHKKKYYSDWDCLQCGQKQIFGSKDKCNNCGCFRSKGIPSHLANKAIVSVTKPGDWTCICGINNFAKRDKCFKCNAPRNTSKEETKVCVVCMERPLEVLIKPCKHICMCFVCSQAISNCPVCRSSYDVQNDVEKVFLSV